MMDIRQMKNYGFVMLFILMNIVLSATMAQGQTEIRLEDIKAYAKAVAMIGNLQRQTPVDWNAVRTNYDTVSPLVMTMDTDWKMSYDQEIREAIAQCAAGNNVDVHKQTIGKGLQHIAVLGITQELDTLGKSTSTGERIAAYFESIRATFVRRDKGFFEGQKTLEAAADQALQRLSAPNAADLLTARRELEDVMARTFALSVLYEVREWEKARDTDPDFCEVKRKEAEIYYRIIQPRINKRSAKADDIVTTILTGSSQHVNAVLLEEQLQTGLGMKLR